MGRALYKEYLREQTEVKPAQDPSLSLHEISFTQAHQVAINNEQTTSTKQNASTQGHSGPKPEEDAPWGNDLSKQPLTQKTEETTLELSNHQNLQGPVSPHKNSNKRILIQLHAAAIRVGI